MEKKLFFRLLLEKFIVILPTGDVYGGIARMDGPHCITSSLIVNQAITALMLKHILGFSGWWLVQCPNFENNKNKPN